MNIIEIFGYTLILIVAVLSITLGYSKYREASYIVWAWAALILSSSQIWATDPFSLELAIHTIARPLFPIFFLLLALINPNRTVLSSLVIIGLTFGLGKFIGLSLGWVSFTLTVSWLFDVIILTYVIFLLLSKNKTKRSQRAFGKRLSLSYVILILLITWGFLSRMSEGIDDYYLISWAIVCGFIAVLQIRMLITEIVNDVVSLEIEIDQSTKKLGDLGDRIRVITENAHDIILEIASDWKILYISPNVKPLLGYDSEDAINVYLLDFFHKDDREKAHDWMVNSVVGKGEVRDPVRIQHGDGSWRWIESTTRAHTIPNEEMSIVIVARDVTSRIQEGDTHRQLQQRFEALAENSRDIILDMKLDGTLLYASHAVVAFSGYTPDELVGKNILDLLAMVSAEDYRPANTDEDFISIEGADMEAVGEIAKVQQVTVVSGEKKWIESEVSIYTNSQGHQGYLATVRDVSDRISFEEQVHQGRLMEGLGLVARGVAHDFNNLLAIVQGNTELAAEDAVSGDLVSMAKHINIVISATKQASGLTSQLLTYAGKGTFRMQALDLNTLITDMNQILSSSVRDLAVVELDLTPSLHSVIADFSQFQQVLLNLVTNSAEASVDRLNSVIQISTSYVPRNESKEGSVCLEVRDNGVGMDDAQVRQVFKPFYSTKFEGRGLGLAAVAGIIKAHRGSVKVTSKTGEGTKFTILLPVTDLTSADEDFFQVPSDLSKNRVGTVLVVDDEVGLNEFISERLKRLGYSVLSATTSQEGLQHYQDHKNEITLVLMDFSMPDLNGIQLLRAMGDDKLKVLFMSGYSKEEIEIEAGESLPGAYIQKPFTSENLINSLNSLLQET